METFLRRWWTGKYKLPWTHESYQNSNEFENLVEYFEDAFEKDPHAALDAVRDEHGEIYFDDFAFDPQISKWEQELKQGIQPDLTEGLSQTERNRLKAQQEKAKQNKRRMEDLEIDDDFTGLVLGTDSYKQNLKKK